MTGQKDRLSETEVEHIACIVAAWALDASAARQVHRPYGLGDADFKRVLVRAATLAEELSQRGQALRPKTRDAPTDG